MLLLSRLLRPLRTLATIDRLVAAAGAIQRTRLAHELRLRALWLRLSCVWLAYEPRREALVLACELDELAEKFTAPPSADQVPKPVRSHAAAQQPEPGASPGRIANLTGERGFQKRPDRAPGVLDISPPRDNGDHCGPVADLRVPH